MRRTTDATRRDMLRISGALSFVGAASPFVLQLAAMGNAAAQVATPDYKALVCVFLFGGNDAHNAVLATDADSWGRYFAARNTGADPIALMPVGTAPTAIGAVNAVTGRTVTSRAMPEFWGGVLPITPNTPNPVPPGTNATTRTFGINPHLAALLPVWNAGRLAVAANVGPLIVPTTKAQYTGRTVTLPANLMSHNDQQSTWQASAAEGARKGWGGQMADQLLTMNGTNSVFTAISTAGNAVFLAGNSVVQYQVTTTANAPATVIAPATGTTLFGSSSAPALLRSLIRDISATSYFAQDHGAKVARSMDSATTLNTAFAGTAVTNINVNSPLPTFTNPVTNAVETNSLTVQLQQVARLIAAGVAMGVRRQVFFVSLGGWDTHDFQNTTQPNLLAKVAAGLAYFDGVLANIGGVNLRNAVTTFTASDFSRTFTSNGDGTDHAWGSHHFVMGGAVAGKNIYGQYPTLGVDQSGFSNPNMAGNILVPQMSVDQYAGTMGSWFGMSDATLDAIFPNLRNFSPRNLGFV
ncbi:MAG TPA: DUF1501 domain-containing protein [Caulobacterales bacterium]|nr:DUF1501 domain-containing protein [Caulobacterales bacterium]